MKKLKIKKPTRKSLIRKLDNKVSEIVRKRDTNCVICFSTKQITAGHLFSRRFYSTRWDLDNVFTQCWPCNYTHGRDQSKYFLWYINKFGLEKFKELEKKAHQVSHFKTADLVEFLEQMKGINNLTL